MRAILGAATFAVIAFAINPASAAAAAKFTCAGDGMMKTNAMVTAMPAGTPGRMAADQQIMAASKAISKGDMRGCNKALLAIQAMKK